MWNRHRESEIQHLTTSQFRYETFYYLWVKGNSTWGERDTIFLWWLLLHRQLSTQPTQGARSAQFHRASPSSECQLSRAETGTQLLFSNTKNPQPTLLVHDVTHIPWSQFLSGIFILTSLNDTSFPCAREHLHSCLHLTNPYTEPKGSHPN